MSELIPFEIETQRVVQLLAKQIYQSPLALLRENTQNAFDAVRQRLHKDTSFDPMIEVNVASDAITIVDNGIGMTPRDLQKHYWTAGSSSKNSEDARAAGVVGTFGIGAMANFGIAERLVVETESVLTGERTVCRAERSKLDLKRDCIERESLQSLKAPGTRITATLSPGEQVDVQQARNYIADFVALVDIPVYVNGELVSQRDVTELIGRVPKSWALAGASMRLGDRLTADVDLVLSNNGETWLALSEVIWDSRELAGQLLLRTGHPTLATFRNGFGLATTSVSSAYQFGGVADLLVLEPTAGREAITVEGLQLLQSIMAEVDAFVSGVLGTREESDSSTAFMNWVVAHGRFDLCGNLRMSISPGDRVSLEDVKQRSASKPIAVYGGADPGIVKAHSSEETPLLIMARGNPRRRCEDGFLQAFANVEPISDHPVVKNRRSIGELSRTESAVAYRITSILEADYFLKCEVAFGEITHGLPVVADKRPNEEVAVTLAAESQTIQTLVSVYENEYGAFGSLVKDFVRTVLFSRIADFVPSSTRQGAEAFLRAIRKSRELFEYADDDLGSLPGIWDDYNEGKIGLEEAVERSRMAVRASVQVVERTVKAVDIVPDVLENEKEFATDAADALGLGAAPAITRLETSSSAKLLVIDDDDVPLRGYRCFLAITDRAREDMGEFFLQPHTTSVVWGGQKTLFIFMHHSGQFGLYYDLQTRDLVEGEAGGGGFPTCSIMLKDRLYIPIPREISANFVPRTGERKRFDVRADILRAEAG